MGQERGRAAGLWPTGATVRLSLAGDAGLRAWGRAWVPVVDQALCLLIAHVGVPLAEAQAHHVVVHVLPDLLAVEAPGDVLAHGEQLFQVLFHMRDAALQFVSALETGRGRVEKQASPREALSGMPGHTWARCACERTTAEEGRGLRWGGTSESGVRVKGPRLGRSTAGRGEPRMGLGATHLGQNVLGKEPVTGRV